MEDVRASLASLERAGLRRSLRTVSGPQGPRVMLDGAEVLLLCSNNYLGLADHPRVRKAAADAAERYGAGAGASRLISGDMELHRTLESHLARFKGTEAALLFGSGYLANMGTVAALAGEGGVVFSDELNHASIIDGCRLARARDVRLPPLRHRAPRLGARAGRGPRRADRHRRRLLDGRRRRPPAGARRARAPLRRAAHGGRGARDRRDRPRRPRHRRGGRARGLVDVVVGTLGKALGSYGAYVCTSAPLRELPHQPRAAVHLLDRSAAAVGWCGDWPRSACSSRGRG